MIPEHDAVAAMEAAGFRLPDGVAWDGRVHRCKANGDRAKRSGWYVAYPDPPATIVYGSWKDGHPSDGARQVWTADKDKLSDDQRKAQERRIKAAQRKRAEADRKRKARAAERYRKLFERAAKPGGHAYCLRKGVGLYGVKQTCNHRLLVPMKDVDTRQVVSVQAIGEDGFKRFAKGGQGTRVYCGIGNPATSDTIYITEGYATGATIHEITGAAVAVAFSAHNLAAVAKSMRGYWPGKRLVIAADNDRGKTVNTADGQQENPGVYYARKAAKASGADVVVPHPENGTDFNDLHAESPTAALQQLDPDYHPPTEDVERSSPPRSEPFRCLGHDQGTYYYMADATGQVIPLRPSQHNKQHFLSLAPFAWWEHAFGDKDGPDWTTATDYLMGRCHSAGIFHPDRVHGRGCWRERDGIVIHLGDRMILPTGRVVDPTEYQAGSEVYQRQVRLSGPAETPMEVTEGARILETISGLAWEMPAAGALLAGWIALAPVCGALRWRPHIWITGGKGAGKSTVMDRIIHPLLSDMSLFVQGSTTEAGIRQKLRADALPVIFDEAEQGDGARSEDRLQGVLELARQASSETSAVVAKGSAGGAAMQYSVRSMFCMCSIGAAIKQSADKSRFALLSLRSPDEYAGAANADQWALLERRIAEIDADTGARLIARTISRLPQILADAELFRRAATEALGTQRLGDQYGYLLAGAWSMQSDSPVDAFAVREFIHKWEWEAITEINRQRDEDQCLSQILQQQVQVDGNNVKASHSVGELVQVAATGVPIGENVDQSVADQHLRRLGIKWVQGAGLFVANSSEYLARVTKGTLWGANWSAVLRRIPGARSTSPHTLSPGYKSRGVVIPSVSVLPE